MHEFSVALALIEQAEEIARTQEATRIVTISLLSGPLNGIVKESLEFCFPSAAKGTLAEGASLKIEETVLTLFCLQCKKESTPERILLLCSDCGSPDVKILKGREFCIQEMEVE